MKELIKITEENGNRAVSARELHNFLEVETPFRKWIDRMFEYGFDENIDFSLLKIGERKAHNKIDYALTIDTAKEIAMLQRTPKGKQARQYFIEMEKVATNKLQISDKPYKYKIGSMEYQGSVVAKKMELLETIKTYLRRGDTQLIAKQLNLSYVAVRNVLNGDSQSKRVLQAVYNKAVDNKEKVLFRYQEMIDSLKK